MLKEVVHSKFPKNMNFDNLCFRVSLNAPFPIDPPKEIFYLNERHE